MILTLATAWLVAAVAMLLLWGWQLRVKNAGVADVGWTTLVGGLAVGYALSGDGDVARRSAIGWMMGSWGARLAVYLLYDRVLGKPEEGRFAELGREWGDRATVRFFWLFQAHAAAAVVFSLPALLASANPDPNLSPVELTAAALWLVAFAGESTADRQLVHFKSEPANAGRTCQAGLWRYSRHPNYFFEWLMWVSYALFASASPWGWIAIACPATMLFLLLKVTGIPAAEAQALRSRGDEYRQYQQTTSAFVPWRRRNQSSDPQILKSSDP